MNKKTFFFQQIIIKVYKHLLRDKNRHEFRIRFHFIIMFIMIIVKNIKQIPYICMQCVVYVFYNHIIIVWLSYFSVPCIFNPNFLKTIFLCILSCQKKFCLYILILNICKWNLSNNIANNKVELYIENFPCSTQPAAGKIYIKNNVSLFL